MRKNIGKMSGTLKDLKIVYWYMFALQEESSMSDKFKKYLLHRIRRNERPDASDKDKPCPTACCDLSTPPSCQSQELITYWRTGFGQMLKELKTHMEAIPNHLGISANKLVPRQSPFSSNQSEILFFTVIEHMKYAPNSKQLYPVVFQKKKSDSFNI
jgi:hypothetical protein